MTSRDELVGLVTCCDCECLTPTEGGKAPYYCEYRYQHIVDDREWIKCRDFVFGGDAFDVVIEEG